MGDVARQRWQWRRGLHRRLTVALLALAAALLALAASGAAAQRPADGTDALRAMQQREQRVLAVSYRLAAASTDLCPDAIPQLGLTVHDLDEYALGDRPVARATFGFDGWPLILAVAPDGPAADAGIRADDAIVAIGGVSQWATASAVPDAGRSAALLDRLDAVAAAGGAVVLTVRRAAQDRTVTVWPRLACRSRFQVRQDDDRNAVANGDHVEIDTGLLDDLTSDDELAAVLAHELSHNILHHRRLLDAAGVDPARVRLSARDARLIRASETAADRLGVYIVDRAGYPTAAIVAYWRRVAPAVGRRPIGPRLHLDPRQRIAVIEREIARIAAMRAAGQVPVPADQPASRNAARTPARG